MSEQTSRYFTCALCHKDYPVVPNLKIAYFPTGEPPIFKAVCPPCYENYHYEDYLCPHDIKEPEEQ